MTDDGAVHSARAKASAGSEIEHQSNPSQVPEGPRSAKRYDGCRESFRNGKQVFFSPIFFGQEPKKMGPPEAETQKGREIRIATPVCGLVRNDGIGNALGSTNRAAPGRFRHAATCALCGARFFAKYFPLCLLTF